MNVENDCSTSDLRQRARVWVVDDSPLESEIARRLLADEHEVEVYANGPSVLEQLANGGCPDVLVLDWHMPDVSGLEVCRFLRQTYDEVSLPILILTATGGKDNLLEGLAAGANDFVAKSFDPAELRARVRTLARSKLLHDNLKRTEVATRQARDAADDANRAKDTFLATVSHELRTPLHSILGWVRLLEEGESDEQTLHRGLQTIARNAELQVQMIDDILDMTRVVSGKLRLELGPVDLATVVQRACDSARPTAAAKELDVQLRLDPERCRMLGDADRLQQAVANLLTNAIKFTPSRGRIQIELLRQGSDLRLCVADSGKGISPQFLPHVFERFRQAEDTTSERQSGLGLGLALVRSIVIAHSGSVTASSAGEGEGATFTVVFPCSARDSTK
jgi:signal transduction histidine kinase